MYTRHFICKFRLIYCAMFVWRMKKTVFNNKFLLSPPQLLITVAFSQPVKLYSMKLQGPDNGK